MDRLAYLFDINKAHYAAILDLCKQFRHIEVSAENTADAMTDALARADYEKERALQIQWFENQYATLRAIDAAIKDANLSDLFEEAVSIQDIINQEKRGAKKKK